MLRDKFTITKFFISAIFFAASLTLYSQSNNTSAQSSSGASSSASSTASSGTGGEVKGDPVKGEELFKTNCSSCHALDKQVVCMPLKDVTDRRPHDWLVKWIKDSKAVIASGDPYANKIYNEYNKAEMTQFPNLSDTDIDDILAYTKNPPVKKDTVKQASSGATSTGNPLDKKIVSGGFFFIVIILLVILFRVNKLVKLSNQTVQPAEGIYEAITFARWFKKNHKKVEVASFAFTILSLFGLYYWMMHIGVDRGYKPEQPIYFSHKIHAGINGIDCQLCHSSAKYGRVSGIPSENVCMNCHKNIPEYKGDYIEHGKDRAFYNSQIDSLFAHTGWDKNKNQYVKAPRPIKWTRLHNMPAFVSFNHSTHVVVGEKTIIEGFNKKHPDKQIDVVCKACHGQVDTMNVVKVANDFTMGWCINCHRTTQVDMTNNYNASYFKSLHAKLAKQYGKGTPITVDAVGGMECGKCHY